MIAIDVTWLAMLCTRSLTYLKLLRFRNGGPSCHGLALVAYNALKRLVVAHELASHRTIERTLPRRLSPGGLGMLDRRFPLRESLDTLVSIALPFIMRMVSTNMGR